MIVIKDAMVMIHLAKMTLLESSCKYFKDVMIPDLVYEEVIAGKEKGFLEVSVIESLINSKMIRVKKVKNENYLKKANEFNIQRGEAESLSLYWQEKANYLAIDDDNVRRKSSLLNLRIIGTPVIILILYRKRLIDKDKFRSSLHELKRIGWFSNAVIDKIMEEAER